MLKQEGRCPSGELLSIDIGRGEDREHRLDRMGEAASVGNGNACVVGRSWRVSLEERIESHRINAKGAIDASHYSQQFRGLKN